jgi:basic amino acid/polyamine antiporter, APA family
MTEKKISGFTATNIVIANMIGTGVFTSLGFQVASIHSDIALIALWVFGGVASLCGALCYAELAAAIPRSGGEYRFLSRIYHPAIGFMAGWVSATVGFAAPIALAAMAFGHYINALAPLGSPVLLSLAIVWLITLIHLAGIHTGAAFQNISTFVKLALILVFIFAGFLVFAKQPLQLVPSGNDFKTMFSGPFAVSMFYVMYSYSGWNGASYITEEVRNPAKNVPLALFAGTVFVAILYVLLNFVFLLTTPKAALSGQLQVGEIAGQAIFGAIGGKVASALISLGLIASISAMAWIGSRVTKAMADDLRNLRFFGRTNERGTPYVAMLFQALIISALIVTSTFEAVLVYIQFSLLLCSFLAVLGLIVLRVREPNLTRPYRVWLYPVTPVAFLVISLLMMIFVLGDKPIESLLGLLTVLAGLIIYFFSRNTDSPLPETSGTDALHSEQ